MAYVLQRRHVTTSAGHLCPPKLGMRYARPGAYCLCTSRCCRRTSRSSPPRPPLTLQRHEVPRLIVTVCVHMLPLAIVIAMSATHAGSGSPSAYDRHTIWAYGLRDSSRRVCLFGHLICSSPPHVPDVFLPVFYLT